MADRKYDVLLCVTVSRVVEVLAPNAKEANRIATASDEDARQLGGIEFTDAVGTEFTPWKAVREGRPWPWGESR